MDETGYIAHQRRSSKASSLVLLGGRNKKAPGKALVCVWLGGEGVRFRLLPHSLIKSSTPI